MIIVFLFKNNIITNTLLKEIDDSSPRINDLPQEQAVITDDIQAQRYQEEALSINNVPFRVEIPDQRLIPLARSLSDGTFLLGDIKEQVKKILKGLTKVEEFRLKYLITDMLTDVMRIIAANRKSSARYHGPKLPYSSTEAESMIRIELDKITAGQGSKKELKRLIGELYKFNGELYYLRN